ncbi:putative coil containing protein [Vibrio phage 191E37-1]|nr:putative coil containing protein [Vibrio phage 191E37-1]
MKNADMPAMPVNNFLKEGNLAVSTNEFQGLTKREMFAMHAMQGLLSDGLYADLYSTADEWRKNITEASVEFADALLEELEK